MLASIFSLNVLQTALELGCIYALVALALFLSYSILNIADLSTDGCFTLGCAVACQVALTGHPILALVAAMAAGVCSGFVTAFLQTRLGVESIMAGIIVNTGLYTINLAVMGFSSTMSLVKTDTVFSLAKGSLSFLGGWYKLAIALAMILLAGAAMLGFLGTRLGLSIRATGDNAAMVRASSINPAFTITVGLCISGALCALSGGLLAQYQKSCDINVGTGMVTIALASLIIGETLLGKRTMLRRIIGVVFGSCLYRFIVAVALRFNVPAAAMKLVSAIIVAIAISMPAIKEKIAFEQRKHGACRRRVTTDVSGIDLQIVLCENFLHFFNRHFREVRSELCACKTKLCNGLQLLNRANRLGNQRINLNIDIFHGKNHLSENYNVCGNSALKNVRRHEMPPHTKCTD